MKHVSLNISNLIMDINMPMLKAEAQSRLSRELVEIFSNFISDNGNSAHEVVEVSYLKWFQNKGIESDLNVFADKSIKTPLLKFPFTANLQKETAFFQRHLKPFFKDSKVKAFLNQAISPEDIVFYIFKKSCLIRNHRLNKSLLCLKPGSFCRTKATSVYEATFFTTALGLPELNAVMLHGVGINRNGYGFLFLGLSGSGKTTIAGFSPINEVISDDGIIIEQKRSKYYLRSTPFDQFLCLKDVHRISSSQRTGLAMGLFLYKDDRVFLEKVSPLKASSYILKNHIHYFRYFSKETVAKTFSLITDICRRVPFYRLHFKKEPSFWPIIEEKLYKIT